jgi:hypothetical protein
MNALKSKTKKNDSIDLATFFLEIYQHHHQHHHLAIEVDDALESTLQCLFANLRGLKWHCFRK